MTRTLPVCAALLALPLAGRAQAPAAPTETVIRMAVSPMPAPKPALRYQLLPELRDMKPGNPIFGYLRCFAEQNHFFFSLEEVREREKWDGTPLGELPPDRLRHYGGVALDRADDAARLTTPDWEALPNLKKEGLNFLVPEVQQMRALAWGLKTRFRGRVAGRHFDEALRTAQTMFALSRHLGEHPTLIGYLVGAAIAYIAIEPLEEMIQQPGCPNLYWALTDLPRPLVSLRKGLQGEVVAMAPEFALLDDRRPMSEAQLQKAVDRYAYLLTKLFGAPGPVKDVPNWLNERTADETHVRAARRRLAEAGLDPARVKKFPAVQVVLLDEKNYYEVRRDDLRKVMALPYWKAAAVFVRQRPGGGEREALFGRMLLGFQKVRESQARLEQRIGLLRCVEALRLYAAEHEGRLPAKLADLSVPVPDDPITGKPFVYHLAGDAATVRGTAPRGMEKSPVWNVRYEVTVRK